MGPAPASLDEVIGEMMRLQRALPPRPSFPELESALSIIIKVDDALAAKLEELLRQPRPHDVLPSVFDALQEMRKEVLDEQAQEQKRAAEAVVKLEQRHRRYDSLIQRTYAALSPVPEDEISAGESNLKQGFGSGSMGARESAKSGLDSEWDFYNSEGSVSGQLSALTDEPGDKSQVFSKSSTMGRNDSLSSLTRSLSWSSIGGDSQQKIAVPISDDKISRTILAPFQDSADLQSSYKVFSMLDMASKKELKSLDLHGVFLKEIEWVPESLGQLTWLTDLNLSGNRLNILPESIGELSNLISLDLSANQLTSLPESLGRLTSLTILNIEKNKIEELPWTIGQCMALVELHADFNQLKALPEATGKLRQLRRLSVHLNCLKSLPSTIASMTSLTELDAHFNQLEFVPEGLCLVTTLTKLNLASNFTDLKELPQQIGRLQNLKDLDISYNHLTVLPDSFAMLTNLQNLNLEGNPLRVPPMHIAELGKEAVLKYMAEYTTMKENEQKHRKNRGKVARMFSSVAKLVTKKQNLIDEDVGIQQL